MKGIGKRQLFLSYNKRVLNINGVDVCCEINDSLYINYSVNASLNGDAVYKGNTDNWESFDLL